MRLPVSAEHMKGSAVLWEGKEGDGHLQLSSAILTADPKDIFFCTAGTGQDSRENGRHSYSDGNKQKNGNEGIRTYVESSQKKQRGL